MGIGKERSSTVPVDGVRAARALFALNAAIWAALAASTAIGGSGGTAWVLAIMMLGNAAAMAAMALGLKEKKRRLYWLALLLLAVNIALTFTDQFGLLDLITLLVDLALLGLLLAGRARYHSAA